MNRTFHSRIRWDQLFLTLIITAICFYMVWVKQSILATLLAIALIVLIERIIHTTYTLTSDNKLILKRGRFSKIKVIDLDLIKDIELKSTTKFGSFYLTSYVLILCKPKEYIAITPANPERFIETIIKRKEHYIDEDFNE